MTQDPVLDRRRRAGHARAPRREVDPMGEKRLDRAEMQRFLVARLGP